MSSMRTGTVRRGALTKVRNRLGLFMPLASAAPIARWTGLKRDNLAASLATNFIAPPGPTGAKPVLSTS